ncbi:LacI family DNA-binding transcriptional regulator [Lacisediminihabitans sp.]|uniref:LacI family DNA-binding transcriptional regulator n=1 Tax=Lacisediminihabitans sp. TaxID=2787631 RepID=UPI00374D0631
MRNVAALAGVGIKTVSRVMNGEANVSAATAARVNQAAAQLNYELDVHAGNLKRLDRRSRTLGLLVGSVANPFSGAMHRAVEDAAIERGIAVFASSMDDNPERERLAVTAFLRRRVDGLILTTATSSQGYLLPEQSHGTPLVFVDRAPVGIDADAVVSDNAIGAATATRHLIEHGHRNIAYIGDSHALQTARERRRGFQEEIGLAGIPTGDIAQMEDLHSEEAAFEAVTRLVAGEHPPTAIFSSQNLVTVGAIRALRRLGLQHRIALVGFDDVELSDLLEPAITVVAQDPRRIGELAVERMFARLDGDRSAPSTTVVPTALIVRGSGEIRPS